jgi:hypothetical protein
MNIDFNKLTPSKMIRGEDEEETLSLKEMLNGASFFLSGPAAVFVLDFALVLTASAKIHSKAAFARVLSQEENPGKSVTLDSRLHALSQNSSPLPTPVQV